MKISEIINAKPVLDSITQNKELPTKTAYKIYLMILKINPSLEFFEQKRIEAFEKYGVKENDMVIIPEEHRDEFMAILNEVGNFECDEKIERVDISLDVNLGISPAEIALLEPFINFIE